MLSQSAASQSAELSHKAAALAILQETHQSNRIALATLRWDNACMEQRLADRALEIKALCEQLARAHVHFEHFQEAIAAQRLEDRRAFERIAGRLERDLAGAQQRLLAQHATLAQQDTQPGLQLRVNHDALTGEARAARKELSAARVDREQLTRKLVEADGHAEAEALKLDKL
ncbi:hypothetical protein LPN04_31000 [Rugamonas sp. A1-17]|nr:hypothetical protein [Rugamonas sp. A1-17]